LLAIIFAVILISCGSGGEEKNAVKDGLESNPIYQKGMMLTERFQCMSCHKVDEKLSGPAYTEVARKYAGAGEATINKLAKKIIEGGSGVWGETMMTSHQNVTVVEAKEMVQYILMLK